MFEMLWKSAQQFKVVILDHYRSGQIIGELPYNFYVFSQNVLCLQYSPHKDLANTKTD